MTADHCHDHSGVVNELENIAKILERTTQNVERNTVNIGIITEKVRTLESDQKEFKFYRSNLLNIVIRALLGPVITALLILTGLAVAGVIKIIP